MTDNDKEWGNQGDSVIIVQYKTVISQASLVWVRSISIFKNT